MKAAFIVISGVALYFFAIWPTQSPWVPLSCAFGCMVFIAYLTTWLVRDVARERKERSCKKTKTSLPQTQGRIGGRRSS